MIGARPIIITVYGYVNEANTSGRLIHACDIIGIPIVILEADGIVGSSSTHGIEFRIHRVHPFRGHGISRLGGLRGVRNVLRRGERDAGAHQGDEH